MIPISGAHDVRAGHLRPATSRCDERAEEGVQRVRDGRRVEEEGDALTGALAAVVQRPVVAIEALTDVPGGVRPLGYVHSHPCCLSAVPRDA